MKQIFFWEFKQSEFTDNLQSANRIIVLIEIIIYIEIVIYTEFIKFHSPFLFCLSWRPFFGHPLL